MDFKICEAEGGWEISLKAKGNQLLSVIKKIKKSKSNAKHAHYKSFWNSCKSLLININVLPKHLTTLGMYFIPASLANRQKGRIHGMNSIQCDASFKVTAHFRRFFLLSAGSQWKMCRRWHTCRLSFYLKSQADRLPAGVCLRLLLW